ncbi:MAG: CCA tRNA nucleotidyltransferase [Candidatus Puniceispirillaceae bacterium]
MTVRLPKTKPHAFTSDVVLQAFLIARSANGEGRLVGGAVRDWLLDRPIGDLDMAVNVPISDFCDAARKAGHRIIETGLSHGSVTLMVAADSIEVTQTRSDVSTDGRHAKIGFHPSWEKDAGRRDFTINALYLDQDGHLFDPLGGMADLQQKNLRFIGKPAKRIEEDYLRILRYFRFLSQLDGFEACPQALREMKPHLAGLSHLSGERIIAELITCFEAPNWQIAAELMTKIGLDIALFESAFQAPFAYQKMMHSWQARLVSFLSEEAAAACFALPFARRDMMMMMRLLSPLSAQEMAQLASDEWHIAAYFGGADYAQRCLVQARYHDITLSDNRWQDLRDFVPPPCPVNGHDLRQAGFETGPQMGAMLTKARMIFAKHGFAIGKDEIIAQLRQQDSAQS